MEQQHFRGLSHEEREGLKNSIYSQLNLPMPARVVNGSFWKKTFAFSAAASLLLVLSGMFLYQKQSQLVSETPLMAVTGANETRQLSLPDGSTVILNAGSSLRYTVDKNSHTREVTLNGNGFFKVKKNALLPKFVVHAHSVAVSVVGTQFNVNARAPGVEVALTSGKVHVGWDSREGDSTQMLPGELLKTDLSHRAFVTSKVDTLMYSAWTKGQWNFRNTTLAEMGDLIEKYYGATMVFNNNKDKILRMTGVLPVTGLHDLVKVISETLQVPIKESGNYLFIQ